MAALSSVSDSDLLSRMPGLVLAERAAAAEVIEHLMEIDQRRLYLDQACSSLYSFCIERLGYGEDGAHKRVRVARVAQKLPRVLDELRRGAIHLTGLFLLSGYLTEQNAEALLSGARGKSRRELEQLLARWFPRPDAPSRIERVVLDAQTTLPNTRFGSGPSPVGSWLGPGTLPTEPNPGLGSGPSPAATWPGPGTQPTEPNPALGPGPTHDYESGGPSSARSSPISWFVVFSSAWRSPFAAVQRLLFGLLGTALSRAQSRAVFQSTIRADPIGAVPGVVDRCAVGDSKEEAAAHTWGRR
jgi:hypothetical protein